jgi:Ca-activated chloride channel homolog
MRPAVAVLVSLLAASIVVDPEEQQEQTTIRAEVNLVELQATVTDSEGRSVPGLSKDAFELLVDGVRQPITVFQGEDVPVSAGIVVDNSASMAPKRADVIEACLAFARASNPRDQMFVVHFSDRARFGLPADTPFTSDISELERAVSRFQLGGTTALYDALIVAMSRLDIAADNRKVLLTITDGGDNSSVATVDEVLRAARKNGTALYTIGIFDAADSDRNPGLLSELAAATGGAAYFPEESQQVYPLCKRIAAGIRLQYALGFTGAEDGKYHAIRLLARDPRLGPLVVRTRAGYLAAK